MLRYLLASIAIVCSITLAAATQSLTGALSGTVRDEQGLPLPGATVLVSSPELMGGGSRTLVTDKTGQLRFLALPPGTYVLDVSLTGFSPRRESGIKVDAGVTVEKSVVLKPGRMESVVVEGQGPRIDARSSGFETRLRVSFLKAVPTRRSGMSDFMRLLPGVSPTSPTSGTVNTLSAFGSGTNENSFNIDGQPTTCPCNGVARSDVGPDFIREVQSQSVGAPAEFGPMQGAEINVITRSGSNAFLYDAAYYGQTARLTSRPVLLPYDATGQLQSGYERARYGDFTTTLGGRAVRDRLWFFAGAQYLRDYDSQPGSDPAFPRTYEQNRIFVKLTWQFGPSWQLVQSLHEEFWVETGRPTRVTPWQATARQKATVPAMTFGHLTHVASSNTVWEARVGRFTYRRDDEPRTGDWTIPGRSDSVTGVSSFAPRDLGGLDLFRTSGKFMLTHYQRGLLGAQHEWKIGGQIERGEHTTVSMAPTGVRFVYRNGVPFQSVSAAPSNTGGLSITTGTFVSDAITVKNRVTINAGLRFDNSRAISQRLHALDARGQETPEFTNGLGTLFTWNIVSPRVGVTAKLTADGATMLRASAGRYSQAVLTGDIGNFSPGVSKTVTTDFSASTGGYTGTSVTTDNTNLEYDPHVRAPHTDEYSIGIDREIGHGVSATMTYVRKRGADFIGWTVTGAAFDTQTITVGGVDLPVYKLTTPREDRRYRLTNPPNYSTRYDGLAMVVEKRQSHGWQAFGSYTFSRAAGLQASSGGSAAAAQASTVAPPPAPSGLLFGRDLNDLTNAGGRLLNDRPQMFRVMGSVEVPRTGMMIGANFQYSSGKPWATVVQLSGLPQGGLQRVLLEERGARRLPSQTLLDLRLSRTIRLRALGRAELMLDVLNVLNSRAFESIDTDIRWVGTITSQTEQKFGQGNVFVDPRRAMLSVRFNVGR